MGDAVPRLFESEEDCDGFASELGTRLIGSRVVFIESTGSTNDDLRAMARRGEPEGTVVVADHQTAGRGREGRRWVSPPGSGLLLSCLLRPDLPADKAGWLTGSAALGAAAGVRRATGVDVRVDWPNDLVVASGSGGGGGKLGGVLAESQTAGGLVSLAVVGVGLNVNLPREEFPADVGGGRMSSVMAELGRRVDRRGLLASVLREIDERYAALVEGRTDALAAELSALCANIGRRVERPGRPAGVAEGIDLAGRLVVRTDEGETVPIGM